MREVSLGDKVWYVMPNLFNGKAIVTNVTVDETNIDTVSRLLGSKYHFDRSEAEESYGHSMKWYQDSLAAD